MIQIPPQAKILTIPVPFGPDDSIDRIVSICKKYGLDPFSGDIFALRDESNFCIGLLTYDGHGFQWCIKRYSEGKIPWWPEDKTVIQIRVCDMQILLWGGNPENIKLPELWRPI